MVYKYYLEMSESEVSQVLDTPRSTIKWLLYAARLKLRQLLGQPVLLNHPFEPKSFYDHPESQEKE